jgi:hypothetical protein
MQSLLLSGSGTKMVASVGAGGEAQQRLMGCNLQTVWEQAVNRGFGENMGISEQETIICFYT